MKYDIQIQIQSLLTQNLHTKFTNYKLYNIISSQQKQGKQDSKKRKQMNQKPSSLESQSFSKIILKVINSHLISVNQKRVPKLSHSVFKWNYEYHFMKNYLKLCNKILKGLNKYHVFKMDYAWVFVGMGLGYISSWLQTQFQTKIQSIKKLQFEPTVREVVIKKILGNEQIRLKLQETVNSNVLMNEDIQINLNYILINKALVPQKQQINMLVKNALMKVLQSQSLQSLVVNQAEKAIIENKDLIGNQGLKFLNSQAMLNIIKQQVAPLIKGEMAQQTVSRQLIKMLNKQLGEQGNQEKLYDLLRQKIM